MRSSDIINLIKVLLFSGRSKVFEGVVLSYCGRPLPIQLTIAGGREWVKVVGRNYGAGQSQGGSGEIKNSFAKLVKFSYIWL